MATILPSKIVFAWIQIIQAKFWSIQEQEDERQGMRRDLQSSQERIREMVTQGSTQLYSFLIALDFEWSAKTSPETNILYCKLPGKDKGYGPSR